MTGSPDDSHVSELPFVFINMAMTADGKIATANRAAASFGTARDHAHLLELRATADAVMAGARTIDSNPVNLGPGPARHRRQRLKRGLAEYNLRVIVTGSGSVNPRAEIFRHRFSPLILLTTARASHRRLDRLRPLVDELRVCGENEIDFPETLRWLRRNWGVNRLLCEGGGELNDALFTAGVANQLHLTVCPRIFGGRHGPTIAEGTGAGVLARATPLAFRSAKRVGDEMFFVYDIKTPSARPHPGNESFS
jgi:riboflavin-specific deaminase-like protein